MKSQKNTFLAIVCLIIAGGFSAFFVNQIGQDQAPQERLVFIFYIVTIVGLIFSVQAFKNEEPKKWLKWAVAVANFIFMMVATWAYIMAKVLSAAETLQ